MGKDSGTVVCRNRDEGRNGQSLVMENQAGGRVGWKTGGKPREWSQVGSHKIYLILLTSPLRAWSQVASPFSFPPTPGTQFPHLAGTVVLGLVSSRHASILRLKSP